MPSSFKAVEGVALTARKLDADVEAIADVQFNNLEHGRRFNPLRRLEIFQHLNDVGYFPKFAGHASGHCGRHAQRLMDAHEIVEHRMKRNRASMVFDLLRKS